MKAAHIIALQNRSGEKRIVDKKETAPMSVSFFLFGIFCKKCLSANEISSTVVKLNCNNILLDKKSTIDIIH